MKNLLLSAALLLASLAAAPAVIFDFNREGSPTFAGYTGINLSSGEALLSNVALSGFLGTTLSSSVSPSSPNTNVFNRDRNSTTFGPKNDFFRDFVGATDGVTYTLTFNGLAAGTYTFTSWHYDPGATAFGSPTQATRSVLLTDANGTAVDMGLATKPAAASITNLNQVVPFTMQFTANGTNPVIITYGGTTTGSLVINGFELVAVPEPSAAMLLVVGLMFLRPGRRRATA
jgi:hypothetical protein